MRAESLTRRQEQLERLRAERQAVEAEAALVARASAAAQEEGAVKPTKRTASSVKVGPRPDAP